MSDPAHNARAVQDADSFKMPVQLPIPSHKQIRDLGFDGDITRFPLSKDGFLRRCKLNGISPECVTNPAWYYAPNRFVQMEYNQ